jgi:hypothetical protein
MPTSADQQNKDDLPPARPLENSHHAPSTSKRRVPSNTFKNESDDDAADARTSPRVSPVHRGEWVRGTPRPFGKEGGTPIGVTA